MGLLARILGRGRSSAGFAVRPESVRSVLVMADEGAPEPAGDAVELVMRVFHARNPEMFRALFERDLWPAVRMGFGSFPPGQRTDAARLAELVRKGHDEDVAASVQEVRYPVDPGCGETDLTVLTVYGRTQGDPEPGSLERLETPIRPRLDLTSPLAERAR